MNRLRAFVLLSAVVITTSLISADAPAPAVVVAGPSGQHEVTAAELAKLPRSKVTIQDHGKSAAFEGTELRNLLTLAGAPAGEAIRGKELMKYVVVEGADGYRVLLTLAELDPAFTDRKVILADRRDGAALSEKEGPFRLAVEADKRPARSVRQVVRITVVEARLTDFAKPTRSSSTMTYQPKSS